MIGEAQGDARVRRLLEQLSLQYDVTSNGAFRLIFDVGEGRTQVVMIDSMTVTYEGREIREVWAIAYRCDGEISQPIANELLRDNNNMKLGAWRILFENGKSYATFAVQIAAEPEMSFLRSVLSVVAEKADEFEKTHVGTDEF